MDKEPKTGIDQFREEQDAHRVEEWVNHVKSDPPRGKEMGYKLTPEEMSSAVANKVSYPFNLAFKGYSLIAQAQLDKAKPLICKAERERLRSLIDKLFEALDHADFSNGVEAFGLDEGRVRAYEFINNLKEEWQALKEGE